MRAHLYTELIIAIALKLALACVLVAVLGALASWASSPPPAAAPTPVVVTARQECAIAQMFVSSRPADQQLARQLKSAAGCGP